QARGDVIDAALGVDRAQHALLRVVIDERLRILVVFGEPLRDGGLVVVGALHELMSLTRLRAGLPGRHRRGEDVEHLAAVLARAPSGDALRELAVVDVEQHDGVERLAGLAEHSAQGLCLHDRAGKPIENEAALRVGLREPLADDAEHRLIVHQLAEVHEGLGMQAERRTVLHGGAQQIPRGNLRNGMAHGETLRLRALTRAGRAQQNNSHDGERPPLVNWKKSPAIFSIPRLRFRRQKAWFLPPGTSRSYAPSADANGAPRYRPTPSPVNVALFFRQ